MSKAAQTAQKPQAAQKTPGRRSPRALIPGAVSLAGVHVLPGTLTADGSPLLVLACYTTRHRLQLAHIPAGAAWGLDVPQALPSERDEGAGLTLQRLGGARLTVEHEGRRAVLDIPGVRLLRETVEALGRYDRAPLDLGRPA